MIKIKAMITTGNKMTNMQLELLKMFKYNLDESQLMELKELLSKFLVDKIDASMDNLWNDKGWSNETIESFANQHMRTPYTK